LLTPNRYMLFASIFITIRSVQEQLALEHKFTWEMLFANQIFFTLIVSLLSTYILWTFVSIIFLDPWHIITSVSSIPASQGSPLIPALVDPISHTLPNIHQRHQRLRILQRPRCHMGYSRSAKRRKENFCQLQRRRQRRSNNGLRRPKRHL
jgi:hypothetical protein